MPDLLTIPTAELAVALILGLNRNMLPGDAMIRSGGFRGWRASLYGLGLDGSTVGIIGYGKVGQAIAQRLQGFGARLIAFDLKPPSGSPDRWNVERVALEVLQRESDIVVVALPLM